MAYRTTVLENGVTIITEAMDSVRSIALGIWLAVGSRDETPEQAGMSHFMEHMMFKGTPARSAMEISEAFDRIGAELNAFTSKEYTCYYARFLDEHLPTAFDILSDVVMRPLCEESAIASERQVVLEEIARYEDAPDGQLHELLASKLMPQHPLGLPVLGSRQTVSAFDQARSLGYHRMHYRAGNTVVAAAGAVDHDRLVALVQVQLTMPEGPRGVRAHVAPVRSSKFNVLTKDTEQAHICWGVNGLPARAEERFQLAVLNTVLGGGMASRLFQEIREKRGLAYAVYSYHSHYQDAGEVVVYAGTRPDNAVQVIRLIEIEISRLREGDVKPEELQRVKELLKGQMILGLESTRSRMTRLGKTLVTDGELLALDEIIERVSSVTAEDVRTLAGRLFDGPHALAVIAPFSQEAVADLL